MPEELATRSRDTISDAPSAPARAGGRIVGSSIPAARLLGGQDPRVLAGMRALTRDLPVCGPAWLRAWYESFGHPGDDPVLLATEADGALAGFLALTRHRRGPFGFVRLLHSTTNGHSQYSGLFLGSRSPRRVAAALFDALTAQPVWDYLQLQGVAEHDAEAIVSVARDRGLRVEIVRRFENRVAQVGGGNVLPRRSRSTEKGIARRERAFFSSGHVEWETVETTEALQKAFCQYLEAERRSWKASGGELISSNERIEGFYRRLIDFSSQDMGVRIFLLKHNGTVISGLFTVNAGNSTVALKIFHDEAWRKYSPGIMLLKRLVECFQADSDPHLIDFFSQRPAFDEVSNGKRPFIDLKIWNATPRAFLLRLLRDAARSAASRRRRK